MNEERPTTAQYMRQVVEHVRARWKAPGTTSSATPTCPVAPPPSVDVAFPGLTEVQLQRLFGNGASSSLPGDVYNALIEMEST